MDTQTTTLERRVTRPAMLLAAVSALVLSFFTIVGPALADHDNGPLVTAQEKPGSANQTCGSFGNFDFEFKVDDENPNGTYDEDHPDVAVTSSTSFEVTVSTSGNVLSWEANLPVDAVFVKGGPEGGHLYDYSDLAFAVHHDNGLTTMGGTKYGVSHVSFCFDDVPEATPTPTPTPEVTPTPTPEVTPTPTPEVTPTPTPEVTPTPTPTPEVTPTPTPTPEQTVEGGTPTPSPTPTPEQSVQGGTPTPSPTPEQSVQGGAGTPAPSLPDGAMAANNGPSPLPTVIFGMILVASLATLAWANVRTARSRA